MCERCDWGSPSSRKEAGHCVNMVLWRELKLSDAMLSSILSNNSILSSKPGCGVQIIIAGGGAYIGTIL